ncbi:MAG: hypothetical protein HWQ38_24270 [Nostoc sp. NMS7]|uniref:hypothetical protein n=1 Tax=Nostoc sp. NMS7 TaxID=2815391 RepID=UPI0025F2D1EB|nr:hypothetical protein [Nostoc sp. NMS7]MBN3949410.1 hypothetical protein [Nostoc sp. NMS7]
MLQPIKLIERIEVKSLKTLCQELEITEFFVDKEGNSWGFQGKNVMAVPLLPICTIRVEWDESYSTGYPFEMPEIYVRSVDVPWNYKEVWDKPYALKKICVRTDVYPLAWVYWWVYFRVEASLALFMRTFVYLLEIWGMAQINSGELVGWYNIKFLRWLKGKPKSDRHI